VKTEIARVQAATTDLGKLTEGQFAAYLNAAARVDPAATTVCFAKAVATNTGFISARRGSPLLVGCSRSHQWLTPLQPITQSFKQPQPIAKTFSLKDFYLEERYLVI
jgi:hypothetical protein